MEIIDKRRYDMFTQVRDFGVTYGSLFPDPSLASQAFAAVNAAIADMDTNDVALKSASVKARAARKRDVRLVLQERMSLLAKTAAVLPGSDAEMRAHFDVRPSGSDQQLLTAARRALDEAGPMQAVFVEHGMPETFLRDLGALIDRFATALQERGLGRERTRVARADIKAAVARAFAAIAQLDVFIANSPAVNAAAREVWKQSRRIQYPNAARRPSPGEPAAVAPQTPPAPAADADSAGEAA